MQNTEIWTHKSHTADVESFMPQTVLLSITRAIPFPTRHAVAIKNHAKKIGDQKLWESEPDVYTQR